MILEINRRVGRSLKEIEGAQQITLEIPEADGTYQTGVGPIGLVVLERRIDGGLKKIAVEGEIFRGAPLKERHKRTQRKVVSIGPGGYGAQTLSKREVLRVREWSSDSYKGIYDSSQMELSLGIPKDLRRR